MLVCKPYFRDENVKCSLSRSYAFWRALFLSSVLTRLCSRDDTALSSVMIRPCPRDDKPLSSGGRLKGFPKSQEKLCRGAVKVVGVILKRNDTSRCSLREKRWLHLLPSMQGGDGGGSAVYFSSSSMFIMRSISSRSWAARVKSSFFAASCMRWRVVSMAFFSCLGDMLSIIGSATFMLGASTST